MNTQKRLVLKAQFISVVLIGIALFDSFENIKFRSYLFRRFYIESIIETYTPVVWILVLSIGFYALHQVQNIKRSTQLLRLFRLLVLVVILNLFGQIIEIEAYTSIHDTQSLIDFMLPLVEIGLILFLSHLLNQLHAKEEQSGTFKPMVTDLLPWWYRLFHFFIDVSVSCYLTYSLASSLSKKIYSFRELYESDLFKLLIFMPIFYAYHLFCEWQYGQTIGKALTNTRVYYPVGKSNQYTDIKRTLVRLIPFEPLTFFTKKGILHDRWFKTEVLSCDITSPDTEEWGSDDLLDVDLLTISSPTEQRPSNQKEE